MSSKVMKLLMGGAMIALAPATQAFADGTQAGTGVTNTFSLSYTVGNDTQTLVSDADDTVTFVVDREIDLTVATNTATVTANPGDTDVTQIFTVTNEGNSTQAYDLDFFQQADGTAPENFDTTVITVQLDVDTDGDGVTDQTVTYTPNAGAIVPTPDVGPDGVITVTVTSSVPPGQADGSQATVGLEANTLEPATPDTITTPDDPTFATNGDDIGGAAGTEVTATAGDGAAGTVETVLADGVGTGANVTGVTDVAEDGDHSAVSVVTVQSADVTASKIVELISQDGDNCEFNPTAPFAPAPALDTEDYLPGACVLYTIEVFNDGTATASDLTVGDTLQNDLVFVDVTTDFAIGGNFLPANGGASPASEQQCTSSNVCQVTLVDGELEGGENGQLLILARVK